MPAAVLLVVAEHQHMHAAAHTAQHAVMQPPTATVNLRRTQPLPLPPLGLCSCCSCCEEAGLVLGQLVVLG